MSLTIERLERQLEHGDGLVEQEARQVLEDRELPLEELLGLADRVRRDRFGRRVRLCFILNARSGGCSEDCAFCAQSARYRTGVPRYGLMAAGRMAEAGRVALGHGADNFSLVTSGDSPGGEQELRTLEEALRQLRAASRTARLCASLGRIAPGALERLRAAGLDCYHHNLETSREFFPQVCTTHSWQERAELVRQAKALGLRTCSGGIVGLGEGPADRVRLALELRALGVDGIPLNFLDPIPGTPLERQPVLDPAECLRIIAMFRLVLPGRELIIAGGRAGALGQLQPLVFRAGADSLMVGDYLTTSGRALRADLEMIAEQGLDHGRP